MNLKKAFTKIGQIIGRGRAFKYLFNLAPMFRRTGGRIIEVSEDLQYVKLRLRLNYRTVNFVGTLYGGHMYSSVDGIYMVQLINILGDQYVIWDKSATIRFKRPGRSTLYAEFEISDEFLDQIKIDVDRENEKDYSLMVHLKDREGVVHAEVEKVIYVASKEFYVIKQKKRTSKGK